MNAIHKFPIQIGGRNIVTIPGLQRVLSVAVQHDKLVLYALVDVAGVTKASISVIIKGTGHHFSDIDEDSWTFMGTHVTNAGSLIWHVWIPTAAFIERNRL